LKKQMELLFRLQSIDSNIKRSETLQRQFEAEVKKLQEELDTEVQKSAAVKEEVDEQMKKHREAEAALKVLEDKKSKVQDKMMAIKTNKEYSAAQHEVASIDQAIGKQEEQIIMAMDAVENTKELISGAEESLKQAQQRFDAKKQQAATELSDYLADIEKQKQERETLMQEIKQTSRFNILHICDYHGGYSDLSPFLDYPGDVVNCSLSVGDKTLSPQALSEMFGRPFMGGLERKGALANGDPQEIQVAVETAFSAAPSQFILGADCTVPGETPWENLRIAVDYAHKTVD